MYTHVCVCVCVICEYTNTVSCHNEYPLQQAGSLHVFTTVCGCLCVQKRVHLSLPKVCLPKELSSNCCGVHDQQCLFARGLLYFVPINSF